MMDESCNIHHCDLPETPQAQREIGNAQVIMAASEEEKATVPTKDMYYSGIPNNPQSPQRARSPAMVASAIPEGLSDEASTNQVEELENPTSWLRKALRRKMFDLVYFLLFKYKMKAFATQAEMLEIIVGRYQEYYDTVFNDASQCLRLVFGIDVIEVDPCVHTYTLIPALGITYDGMMTDIQGIPKTGLLIVVLGIIFIKGNCVSEEVIWEIMNEIGVYNGTDSFLYENPKKLITENFVQEGYLVYNPVPDSDPPSHEFLWGPRAFAETTKMKVLEFFARFTRTDPTSYREIYAEALREELNMA